MKSLLLASLLAALAAPLSAQSLSPAMLLPGDLAVGPAAGDQLQPALSRGGSSVLAVWQDGRANPFDDMLDPQSGVDIYAARFDAAGALLDSHPIVVNQDPGFQTSPRAAFNGSEWLVVFTSQVPTEFFWTSAFEAVRVAADGSVLDPVPLSLGVAATDGNTELFGVASDGNSFLLVWKDWSGTAWKILGQRVAADGTLLDAAPVTLVNNVASQPYGGDVIFAGDEFLVAWQEWTASGNDNVRARRFGPTLAGLGAAFSIATDADYDVTPALATNGTDFYVAWERYNTCCVGGGGQVRGTRLSHTGQILDPGGAVIYADINEITTGRAPAAAWDGQQWIVSFTRSTVGFQQGLHAARISAGGVVLDPGGVPIQAATANQYVSALAALPGGGTLIAWDDISAGGVAPWDVRAAIFAGGTATPLGAVALGTPTQTMPDAVDSGPQTAVAFLAAVSGAQRVLLARVDATGAPLDAEPVQVAGFGPNVSQPHIGWNGSVYLVTWDAGGKVLGRRFDADLHALDATPLTVAASGHISDVAAQGDTFLVAYLASPSPETSFVYTRRVAGATGALLDPAPVAVGGGYAGSCSVTAFAGGYLVAWQSHFTHDDAHADILLALVSAANVPTATLNATNAYLYERAPRVASAGNSALVVWHQELNGADMRLLGRRVSPAGTFLGPAFVLDDEALEQQNVAVAFDGSRYVTGWEDHRAETWLLDSRSDVFGARVGADGSVTDPAGFAVADGSPPQLWAAVAAGEGSAAFTFSQLELGGGLSSYRLALRLLDPASGPWLNVGQALAGAHGAPLLQGGGNLGAGSAVSLALSAALEHAPATLVVGLSAVNAPFKGGVLVPMPDLLLGGLTTDGTGALLLAGTWPAGVPSGLAFWTQAWIVDAAGPKGLSASNALKGTVP
jgi:hypothetical protein